MDKGPSKQKVGPGEKKCESYLPKEQASIQIFQALSWYLYLGIMSIIITI